jgi:hypothetical protein
MCTNWVRETLDKNKTNIDCTGLMRFGNLLHVEISKHVSFWVNIKSSLSVNCSLKLLSHAVFVNVGDYLLGAGDLDFGGITKYRKCLGDFRKNDYIQKFAV